MAVSSIYLYQLVHDLARSLNDLWPPGLGTPAATFTTTGFTCTALMKAIDDFFNGWDIHFHAGTHKGQSRESKQSYIQGITDVLNNCKKFLVDDYDIFLVANDKYNMYPTIAKNSGMQIVDHFKRPVLNRTEKDKGAYADNDKQPW